MSDHPARIIFFGTPSYAEPSLHALAQDSRYDICLVVTQPDRPAGRGHALRQSAVKLAATELNLSVYQPPSLRTAEARAPLAHCDADLFIVAAYGLLFGEKTLAIPRQGCLNLHASLLPKYRGASPVAAAILAGDEISGISLMAMERGLDTGPVVTHCVSTIDSDDTSASLTERLAHDSARLLLDSLPGYLDGERLAIPQDEDEATVTRPLVKQDGWIDWTESAVAIERRVRAMWSWPRAWTTIDDLALQVHQAAITTCELQLTPGSVALVDGSVLVGCGSECLELLTVQPAGGRPIQASDWLRGLRQESSKLGQSAAPAIPGPICRPASPSGS